jgi:hypothetical protein
MANQSGHIYKIANDPSASASRTETQLTTNGIANPFLTQEWIYGMHADAAADKVYAITMRENLSPYVPRLHTYDFATDAWGTPVVLPLINVRTTHYSSWGKLYIIGMRVGQTSWEVLEINMATGTAAPISTSSSSGTLAMAMQMWDDNGVLYFGGGNYISITKIDFNDFSTPTAAPSRALASDEKLHFDPAGPDFIFYSNGNVAQIDNFSANPITKTNLAQGWGGGGVIDVANVVSFTCNGIVGGAGNAADPFLITSAAELSAMASCSSIGYYQLANDVDMTGVSWTPMFPNGFGGVLDGAGYAIENLTSTTTGSGGLFAKLLAGTVKNLRLEEVDIAGREDTGAVTGVAAFATISGVTVTGEVRNTNTVDSVVFYVGGLVGVAAATPVRIEESGVNGAVVGKHVGGLVGYYTTSTPISFSNVYIRGELNPVPTANQSWPNAAPGLFATGNNLPATKGYSTAVREANSNVAFSPRFTGTGGSSSNSFFKADLSITDPTDGLAKTEEELKDIATYTAASWDIAAGWDATKVWGICTQVNDGYPFITASYATNPCVAAQSGSVTAPVVPLSTIQITLPSVGTNTEDGARAAASGIAAGSEVAISGEGVETIIEVGIGEADAPILDVSNQTLIFEVPRSLTPGTYDLTLVSTDFGSITHQGLIKITAEQAFKLAWTKKVGNKVKIFSTLPQGFKVFLNGEALKLTIGSKLIATVSLRKGKNVISIQRDGKQVRRVSYKR